MNGVHDAGHGKPRCHKSLGGLEDAFRKTAGWMRNR